MTEAKRTSSRLNVLTLVLVIGLASPAGHADSPVRLPLGANGHVELRVNGAGQVLAEPHLHPEEDALSRLVNQGRELTLDVRTFTPTETVVRYGARGFVVDELFQLNGRAFAVVHERDGAETAPRYLREVKVQLGRPLGAADLMLSTGVLIPLAFSPLLIHDIQPATAMVIFGLVTSSFVAVLANLINEGARTYGFAHALASRAGRLIRVHEVIRDGDAVVDVAIAPDDAPATSAERLSEVLRGPWCEWILGGV